ncbi:EAL domain-containing protein [Pseudomonas wenzhouensis]|nr:EAL domain-containing protein [Pseudomonas wenzhouensis]MDM9654109.1 EAL domain-containing protein [Pseudomonas wenzhouensis]
MRQALDNNLFKLVYQPKYRLVGNSLQGFEVLIRWFHPEWGPVSPARFIPFAETNGLIVKIGQWVFEEACRQWREWMDAGSIVPQMAINISTHQLESWGFRESLMRTLQSFSVPASAIELEITEGAALSQTQEQMELILALRNEGFSIAIDDFGTGYSSLSQLSTLPASTLKIDRAFVNKILPESVNEPVIEAIIALGHSLGMQIVAEGVETEAQRDFLKFKGCDIAQGFLYSKPLGADEINRLFLKANKFT